MERWEHIERIFTAALERDKLARPGFVVDACDGDADLRREIESMLAADQAAGDFLGNVEGVGIGDQQPDGVASGAVRTVGPYRLLDKIGEGGSSVIYRAVRDDDQYQRRVAVKLLRTGLETNDLRQRFVVERQILASLDHPHIARLFDGGTTSDGVPYFVMEYVEGLPLDRYCDDHRLSIHERLQVFRKVCSAVHYAHQNLVVHRDLKPSNILVDGHGRPKLLDFGIAKLLNPELTASRTTPTATWLRLLTPQFASPEQIRGKIITTASDVFSLGVLLYQLLTGRLPFAFAGRGLEELERTLVNPTPPRPSEAIAQPLQEPSSAEPAAALAHARRATSQQLRRRLRGDLDTIVLTAIRQEPQRRYASVEQLSDDLGRHLDGLPVKARPDTLGYRSGKFLRRHRLGAGVAAALLTAALGFGATLAVQASRIRHERQQAEMERDKAQRALGFVVDLFRVSDPEQGLGETISARELLDRGARKIRQELPHQPEARAALLDTIGTVYWRLGLYDRAIPLLDEALATRREVLGTRHLDTAASLVHLAGTHRDQGNHDAAGPLYREALAVQRALLGEEHPEVAATLARQGRLLHYRGEYERAETLYRQALALRERLLGPLHRDVSDNLSSLGLLLWDRGDIDGAEALHRRSLEILRRLPDESPSRVSTELNNISQALYGRGQLAEAEALLRRSLELRRQILGPQHPLVAQSLNNLASILFKRRDFAEAEHLYRRALPMWRSFLGDGHMDVAINLYNLGNVLLARGNLGPAEERLRESSELLASLVGEQHPHRGLPLVALGRLMTESGRLAEAEAVVGEALELWRRSLPEEHWWIARGESALGAVLTIQGRYHEAEPLLVRSHRRIVEQVGARDVETELALRRLIEHYERRGFTDKAAAYRGQLAAAS